MRRRQTTIVLVSSGVIMVAVARLVLGVGCPRPGEPLEAASIKAKAGTGAWTANVLCVPFAAPTTVTFQARDAGDELASMDEWDIDSGEEPINDHYCYMWSSQEGQFADPYHTHEAEIELVYNAPCHDTVTIDVDDHDGDGYWNEDGLGVTGTIEVYVVKVDLQAVGVLEDDEETPGAYVAAGEFLQIHLVKVCERLAAGVPVTLNWPETNCIEVWNEGKTAQVERGANFDLTSPITLWVKGLAPITTGKIPLTLTYAKDGLASTDTVMVTVIDVVEVLIEKFRQTHQGVPR